VQLDTDLIEDNLNDDWEGALAVQASMIWQMIMFLGLAVLIGLGTLFYFPQ
jgi:hypothetical protein